MLFTKRFLVLIWALAVLVGRPFNAGAAPLLEEHFNSSALEAGRWTTYNGAQWSTPTDLGGFDYASYLTDSANGTGGFYSNVSFPRGQNLRATFRMWHNGPITNPSYVNVGGPFLISTNTGSYTYPNLNWVEAGFAGQDNGAGSGSRIGVAEGGQAFGYVPISDSNPFMQRWTNAVSPATAVMVRVTLGDVSGCKLEESLDGGNTFIPITTDLGPAYDTRGQTASTAIYANQIVSGSANVYIGFGGGNTLATVIDDLVVENDSNTVEPPTNPNGPWVLLVTDTFAGDRTGDLAIKSLIETNLQATVTEINDNDVTPADANGKDLIVISSTVGSANVTSKFVNSPVGVIVWENALFDEFNMTPNGSNGTVNTNTIAITNPGHPLAAGLSGNVQISTQPDALRFATPTGAATGAVQVASMVGDGTQSAILAYETGSVMENGQNAAGRRVVFPLSDALASASLTADGIALFEAAAIWASSNVLPVELSDFDLE